MVVAFEGDRTYREAGAEFEGERTDRASAVEEAVGLDRQGRYSPAEEAYSREADAGMCDHVGSGSKRHCSGRPTDSRREWT